MRPQRTQDAEGTITSLSFGSFTQRDFLEAR